MLTYQEHKKIWILVLVTENHCDFVAIKGGDLNTASRHQGTASMQSTLSGHVCQKSAPKPVQDSSVDVAGMDCILTQQKMGCKRCRRFAVLAEFPSSLGDPKDPGWSLPWPMYPSSHTQLAPDKHSRQKKRA